MRRRDFLAGATAASLLPARPGRADDSQGVSAAEIRIGNTAAYSGPASAYGIIAKTEPRCSRW
jgi:branched-chain amino acid transport system substrate-binding protein